MAIEDLFDFAEYEYIDQGMKEWMKSTICGDFSTRMDSKEKDFTLILFEKFGSIVKAAHVKHSKRKGEKRDQKNSNRIHKKMGDKKSNVCNTNT